MSVIGKIAVAAAVVGAVIVATRLTAQDLTNTFWVTLWIILLVIVALPALIAVLADSKGQAAAGWLMLMGIVVSAVLAAIYLATLAIFLLVSFIF